ncbi:putative O-methyltransferase domain, plant methyltransferase dimerization [Helianthus annuus]|nr:putative O-methyltransferase domain, plant methyltransferase dimerization [Helianthus annuus]
MVLQNDEQSSVLLDSQAHILNYAYSFVSSMSLKCAIELEIPDIIHRHGVPMSLSELVDQCPPHQQGEISICGIFEELDSVVDVGGGTRTFAKCIAEAFPNLSYINFDLPQVVKGLERSKNLSFVGGDMFETIPKAQAVFFKIKENGGKVIIIEIVLKDEELGNKTLETQLFYDMFEFTMAKGRQRSEKDWAKLFHDACFSGYKIYPVLGIRSVIKVYP